MLWKIIIIRHLLAGRRQINIIPLFEGMGDKNTYNVWKIIR
jgi:hypothetical protein